MIILHLLSILFFSLLLVKATDILIINLKRLARSTKLGNFAVTTFIIALATSLPELFVGISSALEGSPVLSLGNVIGSNIANLSLVVGGAALISGSLSVQGSFLKKDVYYAFLAGAAPMILLLDRSLSRVDGLILLILYGFYNVSVLSERAKEIAQSNGNNDQEEGIIQKIIRRLNHHYPDKRLKEGAWIFLGAALLLLSADMLVKNGIMLASRLKISVLMIGLFFISVGTTLPELVFEIKAIRRHHPSMVFGNLLGSLVANGTLIIGLTSVIQPFKVKAFSDYLLATMAYVVVFGLFFLFIKTKKRLDRWEGALLVLYFLVFALLEFLR